MSAIAQSDSEALRARFLERGWCRFAYSDELADWVQHSLGAARNTVRSPEFREWLRCGDTWFVGVNALANDEFGAVAGGPPLQGPAIDFIRMELGLGDTRWDRAQVSVCYPGYPQPTPQESRDAYRFRVNRAAAHIDGVMPEGPERRRHLRQHHAFILGIPMVEVSRNASPFTIWEGSHEIVRQTFEERFRDLAWQDWGEEDITDMYRAMRRRAFDSCRRVEITANPGEAYLVHRLALHGIAPWGQGATAGEDGRMICYFRPELVDAESWLTST